VGPYPGCPVLVGGCSAVPDVSGDLAAVVSCNDGMATGAFAALQAHNLDKKVYVTGEDCDLARVQLIAQGYPAMSGWTPILKEAAVTCQVSYDLAAGKKLPKPDQYYNNGGKYTRVPARWS